MTDLYFMLTSAIPTKMTIAPQVPTIFMKYWIMLYGTPEFLITDNGPQIVSNVFQSFYVYMVTKLMKTTAYQPQINR